jgi:hypothetical protein
MMIQPAGNRLQVRAVDTDGFIVPLPPRRIPAPWRQAVLYAVQSYLDRLGHRLHSVYVRGSIAAGNPVDRKSDLDTIAVIRGKVSAADDTWCRRQTVKDHGFPFCTRIEYKIYGLRTALYLREPKILIKVHSICVHGTDLRRRIPGFKADKNVALFAPRIGMDLARYRSYSTGGSNSWDIWIIKRILRCGLELSIERTGLYSVDLTTCFRVFALNYPQQRSQMHKVLRALFAPSSSKLHQTVSRLVEQVGPWLERETKNQF